jgi:hypothetical protein
MTRRILSAVARTISGAASTAHDTVHFHNDAGQPAPCFDARCARPQLDT